MNQSELKIINDTQDEYENLLIEKILNKEDFLKNVNFSSPTGTGKTKMMADVIQKMDENNYFFIITTLSKGQLKKQIKKEISKFTIKNNWQVYGLNDFTKSTKLQANDIFCEIPSNKTLIWFRDEGHIATNRWMEILEQKSSKIVNFSATNPYPDIKCNFTHTMMLRTVVQSEGTPEDALNKLLEVKKQHQMVQNYNPCAVFRILDHNILNETIIQCKKLNLKYIDITDEAYDMSDICRDDNEYDVIINKFKIVEGIDIRRAHVLYMTNEPKNPSTTIQVIGRCRRNALLYRNDIDILAPENEELLKNTRVCYCFYNVKGMNIDTDENGELVNAFCPLISVESLKPNITIHLENGKMSNGLEIFEAQDSTGDFKVIQDETTGFKILNPLTLFYLQASFFEISFENDLKQVYQISDFSSIFSFKNNKFYKINKIPIPLKELLKSKLTKYKNFEKNKNDFLTFKTNNTFFTIKCFSYSFSYTKGFVFDYQNKRSKQLQNILELQKNNEEMYKKLKEDIIFFTTYWENYYSKKGPKTKNQLQKIEPIFEYKGTLEHYKEVLLYSLAFQSKNHSMFSDSIKKERQILNYIKFIERNKNLCQKFSSVFDFLSYIKDGKITKDIFLEDAILSGDTFKVVKKKAEPTTYKFVGNTLKENRHYTYNFVEDKAITSKIAKHSKLNIYISKKYATLLNELSKKYYYRKNNIFETKKFNSMFGWCVEYTVKEIIKIQSQERNNKFQPGLLEIDSRARLIRNAIEEYQRNMRLVYNVPATVLPSISYEKLISEKEFATKTFECASSTYYFLTTFFESFFENGTNFPKYYRSMKKCHLSTTHHSALADFVIGDTIIDLKCTNSINEKYIKQILVYYWLSEQHKLNIHNIMIYEVMSNRWLKINMQTNEITSNY